MLPDQFQHIISQFPAFISLFSPDGSIAWLNLTSYGMKHSDMVGQPSDMLILEDDRPLWWESFRRALREKETVRYRVRVGTPEPPHIVTLAGKLAPVILDGQVAFVGCVCWGLTPGQAERGALPAGIPAGARWLSPICEQIVAHLDSHRDRWVKSMELARAVEAEHGNRFRAILTNLVDRRILEARPGLGYRIAVGG